MKEITTIQMSWEEVAEKIEVLLKKILGKKISCKTSRDDYDFWGVIFCGYRMNFEEIEKICDYVNANEFEREEAFPISPDTHIRDMGGEIANRVLGASMNMSFKKILAAEDSIYLIGCTKNDKIEGTNV